MNEIYENFLAKSDTLTTDFDLINNLKGNWTHLIIKNSIDDHKIKVTIYFIFRKLYRKIL